MNLMSILRAIAIIGLKNYFIVSKTFAIRMDDVFQTLCHELVTTIPAQAQQKTRRGKEAH